MTYVPPARLAAALVLAALDVRDAPATGRRRIEADGRLGSILVAMHGAPFMFAGNLHGANAPVYEAGPHDRTLTEAAAAVAYYVADDFKDPAAAALHRVLWFVSPGGEAGDPWSGDCISVREMVRQELAWLEAGKQRPADLPHRAPVPNGADASPLVEALRTIASRAPATEPDEADHDDMESAFGNGQDVARWEAGQVARKALEWAGLGLKPVPLFDPPTMAPTAAAMGYDVEPIHHDADPPNVETWRFLEPGAVRSYADRWPTEAEAWADAERHAKAVPVGPRAKCDNCDWEGPDSELGRDLGDVPHLGDRLEPGGEVPAGECGKCGALAYRVKVGS